MASYAWLLAALTLSTLVWPSGGRDPNVVIWLLLVIPLVIFLPGMVKGAVRTHAWLCFVTLLYFLMAVPNLFVPGGQWLDAAELTGSVTLFLAAMFYVRWSGQDAKLG